MIRCLECGNKFRQITYKHLVHHSMTTGEYKFKYKLKKSETICEETRKLKIGSQSKCGQFLNKVRPTSEAIRLGMSKKFKHFWGDKISVATKGHKKKPEHCKNISISRTKFCRKFRILKDSDILLIRKLYIPRKHTPYSLEGLAKKFKVSDSTIYAVISKSHGYKWG